MPVTLLGNKIRLGAMVIVASIVGLSAPVSAELTVSQLVVELTPNSRTSDVLIFNDSDERSYVSIEPREVINAGTSDERRVANPDPRSLGLLLSSTRLILEPRQKRLLRIASTSVPQNGERIYRVVVKPVVGDVESASSGLKLLVGYDMLVISRSGVIGPIKIEATRTRDQLMLTNRGVSSVELLDGKECRAPEAQCTPLPAKRLYAGASWTQPVVQGGRIEYRALSHGRTETLKF